MPETKNYFEVLNSIDVSDKTEKKNGLTYLSWAWAWGEVKKRHPDANYTIYENVNPSGYVCNYFTDGNTCWVKTGVSIHGIEHIEELPVMDFKNKSIPLSNVTSFDVNKAIQRSLTKAVARHGLGLYIYAGEDLPEDAPKTEKQIYKEEEKKQLNKEQDERLADKRDLENQCIKLGIDLNDTKIKSWIADKLLKTSGKATLDESFNLGQYLTALQTLIEGKNK